MRVILIVPLHWLIWIMSFPRKRINTTFRLALAVHIGQCLCVCCTCVCWNFRLGWHEERFLVRHLWLICIDLVGCSHRIERIVNLCEFGLSIVLFCSMSCHLQFFFSLPDCSIFLRLYLLFWSHLRRLLLPTIVLDSRRLDWAHCVLISGSCHWRMEVWFITLSNGRSLQILIELITHWMFEIWFLFFFCVLVNIFYFFIGSSFYSRLSLLIQVYLAFIK